MARTVTTSPWTHEDRVLMLARAKHRSTLCPGCGEPKDHAWHVDMEGHYEVEATFVCHSCSARKGSAVEYVAVVDSRDYAADPLHGHYLDHVTAERPPTAATPQRGPNTEEAMA